MENEVKGYLRSLGGKDYLCIGSKGYILYPETANVLRNILPKGMKFIRFSTTRSQNTIIEIHISKFGDRRGLKYIDNSGTVIGNSIDCAHPFEDYDVPEIVYVNYNSE